MVVAVGRALHRRWHTLGCLGLDEEPAPQGGGEERPPAGKNPDVDYRGQRRRSETYVSRTDPDARLARKGKGQPARLCFARHVLMEHWSGLVVDVQITGSTGAPEREFALGMLDRPPRRGRKTVGGDRAYDTKGFVAGCRQRRITPHVAQYPTTKRRRSAIDGRTMRHHGCGVNERFRRRVEEIFGWVKTVGGGRKLRLIGLARNQMWAELTAATYDLVRMVRLDSGPAPA